MPVMVVDAELVAPVANMLAAAARAGLVTERADDQVDEEPVHEHGLSQEGTGHGTQDACQLESDTWEAAHEGSEQGEGDAS
jgi:hypothetical protein